MKLKSFLLANHNRNLIILVGALAFIIPFLFYIILIVFSIMTAPAPIKVNVMNYQDRIQKIDIVDWNEIDTYTLIKTLDPQDYDRILSDLSNLSYAHYGFGDPPTLGGICVLLTLESNHFYVACPSGYGSFTSGDPDVDHDPYRYVKSADYEAFLNKYISH